MPARAALAVLCAAQFVLILDVAVVNVALVPLARDLGAAPGDLQLVASAYAATFGGLLLVAGRVADAGRHRTVFVAGLVLFAAASALCGAAGSVPVLVAGRAVQGAGAALASPAALSLLTTVFREGPQRDRALGVWASVAAAGGAAGLLAGGALTATLGWRTVFLVNLPIVAAAVVAGLRVLPGDRPTAAGPAVRLTTAAASCGTVVALLAGLAVIEAGGRPGAALAAFVTAGACVIVFATGDRRATAPLLPGMMLRRRPVLAANLATLLMSAVVLGTNFFLAVHLQQQLGLTPVLTGLAFLPITAVSAATAMLAARGVARIGPRPLLVGGLLAMAAGCLVLSGLPVDGAYATSVLPGMLLVAAGMGPGFAVGTIAATTGVPASEQGAAAALLSASTQIGAAVGLAVLGVVAAERAAVPGAGARAAFVVMCGLAGAAAVAAALLPPRARHDAARRPVPTPLPAQAASCLPACADLTRTASTARRGATEGDPP
jgi:MFS family permease